uniref:Xylanase inhibitor N-terminal domain-containing protein n=1 Tax=Aegilops tauschii subsp. strangulata TaxID=200361 RepID=A0A453DI48_AEGTS
APHRMSSHPPSLPPTQARHIYSSLKAKQSKRQPNPALLFLKPTQTPVHSALTHRHADADATGAPVLAPPPACRPSPRDAHHDPALPPPPAAPARRRAAPPALPPRCARNSAPCRPSTANCSATAKNVCPPYLVVYGSGSTAGLLVSDTLRMSPRGAAKRNFAVGCSLASVHQPPSGLAGFGRGASSVPAQLGVNKFSYCLLSRHFDDDATVSGELVLGASSAGKAKAMQYAPLLKNAGARPPYSVYYYLSLAGIAVGGKSVALPARAFAPVS